MDCFVASLLAMTVWLFENVDPSCPDLIWASINLHDEPFSKKMDHRVKPGDDNLKLPNSIDSESAAQRAL